MRWRWPPWRDPEASTGGEEALKRAEQELKADRARGPEVRREVAAAYHIRARNGFGDAMIELMRSVRP